MTTPTASTTPNVAAAIDATTLVHRTRSFRSVSAVSAVVFLVVVGGAALLAPLLPLDPTTTDLAIRWQPPSAAHWFGTDELGRDYFSRVVYGARISLTVGILAMAASTAIGVLVGLVAGFAGGRVDDLLMRFVDFLSSIPWMVLVIVASVFLKPGLWTIIFVISVFSWMATARLVRAETLTLRERPYVRYAGYIGVGRPLVLWRHVVPDAAPTIIVAATASISTAILTESALSFLGLGIQPPMASWGSLLETAQGSLQTAPYLALIPGVLILLTVLSFNVLGDALRQSVGEGGAS
ncbi:ABC transporter permease [Microbacterium sp. M3]|uniref:ABC transporter permease n=1 Tax=Microbacterium arthrosphaerae TaxID=792652 RepID=A0ABU4H240_9MICO|nr:MULTISPECIES: ABC transporter permease [Microbacterium]MDW4573400.1 ABC transporter permease [Microbacterium arthrosphaerae]MDW7607255.1 ABC transporter permease [Microbacterium sp. M3]